MNSTFYPTEARYFLAFQQLQEYLGDKVVLHHADHALQQLRIFCPQQNFRGALDTWQAPELFQPLPHLTPLNLQDHLMATVPPGLRTRYKWGFRTDFTIPRGIVNCPPQGKQTMAERPHSSPTTTPLLAISFVSPAEHFSFHNTRANFPFLNSGNTSTPTSLKLTLTLLSKPPTTTLSASSTQFPNIA